MKPLLTKQMAKEAGDKWAAMGKIVSVMACPGPLLTMQDVDQEVEGRVDRRIALVTLTKTHAELAAGFAGKPKLTDEAIAEVNAWRDVLWESLVLADEAIAQLRAAAKAKRR